MKNSSKVFYICSYGGSGSKMLTKALSAYGHVEHIHSRSPPEKLEYVGYNGGGRSYVEWFNSIPIPESELKRYYVIYIYRNPVHAIYSRFSPSRPNHCINVQLDKKVELNDVVRTKTDLFKLEEFYRNYTTPNSKRNYEIICVKYEDIFDKIDDLTKLLGVGSIQIKKNETEREKTHYDELCEIYKNVLREMESNDFIMIR